MHRKILAVVCGLLLAAVVLVGRAMAAEGEDRAPFLRIAGQANSGDPAQIRFITPTPTPINLDDNPSPVRSEAGRDIAIIAGATILVLIVIGGVIFGLRWRTKPKTRD